MESQGIAIFFVLVAIATTYPDVIDAAYAETWDDCECYWDPWEPWQDCTSTCFGRQLRTRSVWLTQYDGCSEFNDCATDDEGYEYQGCNEVCHNGGTDDGWPCSCTLGYYGSCCTEMVNCGVPDPIDNGQVLYPGTYYGDVSTYSCLQGYNMTGGDRTRTCRPSFVWSGTAPSCVYAEHCSSAPCQNGGDCIDNLGSYTCICQAGWNGTDCENDVQPPVVEGCSSDIDVNATDTTVNVSWTAPTFSDPMLTDLMVTNNYPTAEFTFPWGDFTVQYVATKPSNGLQTECTFQIRVRPTPCEELNTPINGAVVCNGWQTDYGRFCLLSCREGFTIDPALSYDTWFVCGASGTWTSSNPLPDCTVPIDGPMDTPYQPEYSDYSIASCNDVTPIKSLYIEKLQQEGHNFSEFCSYYPDECNVNNVYIACS